MVNLRSLARGRPCQVRLPCCNGDWTTTVLAHYRLSGISGMGMKSPDLIGAWACSACHDEVDRRTQREPLNVVRQAHAHGVFRTQAMLLKEGVISA